MSYLVLLKICLNLRFPLRAKSRFIDRQQNILIIIGHYYAVEAAINRADIIGNKLCEFMESLNTKSIYELKEDDSMNRGRDLKRTVIF